MIRSQRKMHYYLWLLLAVLLPAGIIAGWKAVPALQREQLIQPVKSDELPLTVATVAKPGYRIRLLSDETKKNWQLEWTNPEALTVPSALVYQAVDSASAIGSAVLIGRVAERGAYYFRLAGPESTTGFHFIFYDIIHHRILDRIDIKP